MAAITARVLRARRSRPHTNASCVGATSTSKRTCQAARNVVVMARVPRHTTNNAIAGATAAWSHVPLMHEHCTKTLRQSPDVFGPSEAPNDGAQPAFRGTHHGDLARSEPASPGGRGRMASGDVVPPAPRQQSWSSGTARSRVGG